MQAVVAAGFVMQYQRRRFGLSRFVADFYECCMVERKWRLLLAERSSPFVRNFSEVRVRAGAKDGDDFGQRIREVLVIADAEAVAFHDDLAAEAGRVVVQRDDRSAIFGREDWIGDRVSASGEQLLCFVPVESVDSFLYVGTHECSSSGCEV